VAGKLVSVAVDDLLHDLNLRVSVGSRHPQQKDTGMWLLRMVDQLTKVGVHGEDDALLAMGKGEQISIWQTPVHITGEGHIVTAIPQNIGNGKSNVHVH
jgi:hypothetical protein